MNYLSGKYSSWVSYTRTIGLVALLSFLVAGCATVKQNDKPEGSNLSSGAVSTDHYNLVKYVVNEASVGEGITYNYNITAKTKLKDVTLTDKVPAGSEVISMSPDASVSGDVLVWNLGKMEPTETKNVQLTVKAKDSGVLKSCAYITAIPLACTQTNIGKAAIAISKTGPSQAKVGDAINFNVIVKNPGTFTAKNVVVTDMIPSGLAHADGKSALTFDIGELEPGDSRNFTIPVKATRRGEFTNVAKVNTSNAGSGKDEATVVVLEPALSIAKSGPAEQYVAKIATYKITVKNTGDTTLKNLTITDTVPAPLKILPGSGAKVNGNVATWTIDSLAKGAQQDYKLTVTSMQSGSYTNSVAVVEAGDGLSGNAAATTLWKGFPALLIEVVDTVDPLIQDETTRYVITVTNQGSAADSNIVIKANFPEQISPVAASGATSGTINGKQVTFAPLLSLAPKQQAQFVVDAKAVKEGDGRINVSMESGLLKTPVNEEESTHVY